MHYSILGFNICLNYARYYYIIIYIVLHIFYGIYSPAFNRQESSLTEENRFKQEQTLSLRVDDVIKFCVEVSFRAVMSSRFVGKFRSSAQLVALKA